MSINNIPFLKPLQGFVQGKWKNFMGVHFPAFFSIVCFWNRKNHTKMDKIRGSSKLCLLSFFLGRIFLRINLFSNVLSLVCHVAVPTRTNFFFFHWFCKHLQLSINQIFSNSIFFKSRKSVMFLKHAIIQQYPKESYCVYWKNT